jgi:hypothetical protein
MATYAAHNLGAASISNLAVKAGFTTAEAAVMTGICLAESSGNITATHKNSNGSVDFGLAQINSIHKDLCPGGDLMSLYDPGTNLAVAHKIYVAAGNKFTPWVTYNNGAYKKNVPGSVDGGFIPNPANGIGDATANAPDLTGGIAGALSGFGNALNKQLGTAVGNAATVLIAVVLLVLGVVLLLRSQITNATPLGKVASLAKAVG